MKAPIDHRGVQKFLRQGSLGDSYTIAERCKVPCSYEHHSGDSSVRKRHSASAGNSCKTIYTTWSFGRIHFWTGATTASVEVGMLGAGRPD